MEMPEEIKEKEICCQQSDKRGKEPSGFLSGLVYGLVPHIGCIAFIIFTIVGATTATALFRPLLLSRYFFYLLILLSFVFATISAMIYLKRCRLFSWEGIKKKKSYLSILYGTSIAVNLLLFIVIFPIAANTTTAAATGFSAADYPGNLREITLKVDIPCPGHAPLISEELKAVDGVGSVNFRFPNYFDVGYDPTKTSEEKIASLSIFDAYPATKIAGDEDIAEDIAEKVIANNPQGCSRCGGCNGACGGRCST